MTPCARGTRTLEDSAGVAAVTADILVSAIEVKSGAEMVELLLRVRRRGEHQQAEKNGD